VAITFLKQFRIKHEAIVRSVSDKVERLDADQACRRVPVLHRELVAAAVYEADAADIDVHTLHQGFLRGAKAKADGAGAKLVCDAEVLGLAYRDQTWELATTQGTFSAPVVVNAAGAWADVLGQMAGASRIGLTPMRRSAFTFQPAAGIDASSWPLFMRIDESFYVKPDAGMLLGSPANADPVAPHDVQAEELDIAIAIDHIQNMTTLNVRRPSHVWAGLRSFVADGSLVAGFDPRLPGFFWAAGQGGYGIQSAPAAGEAYAAMLRGLPIPDHILAHGVDAAALSPARLSGGER
jgi:D-arginine dehydrogenase